MPVRQVAIHRLELMRVEGDRAWVRIECEKGTYVRSLCRDIARAVGTRGYLTYLLRTQSGAYRLEDGLTLAQAAVLAARGCLPVEPMEDAVAFLPALSVAADRERGLRNGLRPPLAALPQHPHVRVYCGGAFFGIGHGQIGERGPELKLDLYLPPEEA